MAKSALINRLSVFVALGVVFIALFLRLVNPNSLPVFVDEAIYVRWSQVMKAEPTLRFLPLSDGKQPLFMWLVMPTLQFFDDPLVAGRFVSAMAGVGTVIGVMVLGYVATALPAVALMGGFLYAISPFSVFFDRLALADSTLTFFGVWTLIFFLLAIKEKRFDVSMVGGFFLGGALLTKSPGVYFAILTPILTIVYSFGKKPPVVIKEVLKNLFILLPAYLIAFGMYNVLRLGPNFHMISLRNADYVYPLSHVFVSPFDPLMPFLDRTLEYFAILGPSMIIVVFVIGLYFGIIKLPKQTISILLWGILPIIVSSEFSRTMTARYVYFSVPYFFVIAAMFLLGVSKKFRYADWLIGLVFVTQALLANYQLLWQPERAALPRSERSGYLEDWTSGYGIRQAALKIEEISRQNPSQKIVIGTEGFFGTLPDGLQMYLNHRREITVIGVGVYVDQMPQSLLESKRYGNRTFLLINDSRLVGGYTEKNMTLVSKYPKAIRPDGSRESLLLLELNEAPKI